MGWVSSLQLPDESGSTAVNRSDHSVPASAPCHHAEVTNETNALLYTIIKLLMRTYF